MDTRQKFKDRLKELRLGRKTQDIRDDRLQFLQKKLKRTKDKTKREEIKKEIKMLENIEDKEIQNLDCGDNVGVDL